jgi:hypothetical protein
MFDDLKHKFLFKCDDCAMIFSVELEEDELERVNENKFFLECACGGKSHVLRD